MVCKTPAFTVAPVAGKLGSASTVLTGRGFIKYRFEFGLELLITVHFKYYKDG
jgi:hypothetical protein